MADEAVSRVVSIIQDRRVILCVHMKTISIALCRNHGKSGESQGIFSLSKFVDALENVLLTGTNSLQISLHINRFSSNA